MRDLLLRIRGAIEAEVSIPVLGVGTALWGFLMITMALIRRLLPAESQRWAELMQTGSGDNRLIFFAISLVLVAGLVGLQSTVDRKWNKSGAGVSILIAAAAVASSQIIPMMQGLQNSLANFVTIRALALLVGLAGASVLVNRAVGPYIGNARRFPSRRLIESR